jgi:UDP-N-acetylmuramate--alanine ligase
MEAAYVRFINAVGANGLAILCLDDERIRRLLPRIQVPVITYGFSPEADVRVANLVHQGRQSSYNVIYRGENLGSFLLNTPGRHNVLNSLAAVAVGRTLGVTTESIAKGLSTFSGVKRRFQFIGESTEGVKVFDDYAHHPTEIRATLASARLCSPKRVVVIFQPHRFSRTEILAEGFSQAFADADVVLLMPIYAAGEKQREGISSEKVYQMTTTHHPYVIGMQQMSCLEDYIPLIASQLDAGDWVFTVGAGDVNKMGQMILNQLQAMEQK